jgi:hypothetical protein
MGAAPNLPQTPGSNVLMAQCNPHPYDDATVGFTPYKSAHRAIVAMEYQNEAGMPATAIVFGLVSGGKIVGLGEDDGMFAREPDQPRRVSESGNISARPANVLRGSQSGVRKRDSLV